MCHNFPQNTAVDAILVHISLFSMYRMHYADILTSLYCSFNSKCVARCLHVLKICDSAKLLKRNEHTHFEVFNFENSSGPTCMAIGNGLGDTAVYTRAGYLSIFQEDSV